MRVIVLALLLVLGCSSEPTDETPSGAVKLFLEAMTRSEWDESALRDAYALLSREARDSLADRARTATALAGRPFEPWQMLAQGRFHLRFSPRPTHGMHEEIEGNRGTVIVTGGRDDERAEVPLVQEDGVWRIVLSLPPL